MVRPSLRNRVSTLYMFNVDDSRKNWENLIAEKNNSNNSITLFHSFGYLLSSYLEFGYYFIHIELN